MATQINVDHIHLADKGKLMDPKQSAGFTIDPMLTPVSTSTIHPILPDPTPSENPELFDPSTRHANTHYHPEKKLSKKKQAKKLGVGTAPHHAAHTAATAAGGGNHGTDTFSAHEKSASERQHKRDEMLAAREQHQGSQQHEEEDEEEDEEDDDDDTAHEGHSSNEASMQSKQQHHSERITGQEGDKGQGTSATGSRSQTAADKSIKEKDQQQGNPSQKEKEQGHDKEAEPNQSLLSRATGAVSGLAQKAMNVPMVSSVLSKVGLGSNKNDDGEHEADKGSSDSGKKGSNESAATNEDVEAAAK